MKWEVWQIGLLWVMIGVNVGSTIVTWQRHKRLIEERAHWREKAMQALGFCAFLSRGPGRDQLPEWVTTQAEQMLPPGTEFSWTEVTETWPRRVH